MKIVDYLRLTGCLIILTWSIIFISPFRIEASVSDQSIYPIDSKPYGLSYGEWTAKWWQWAYSIPTNDNPTADETGAKCGVGQNDTNVWFLSGTGGGKATRTCTIPAGKAILIPLLNVQCSYITDPALKSESELRECAKEDQDKGTNLQASIDGVAIPDLKKYRVQSPLFNITYPKDNVAGVPQGTSQAISDGYWILIKPLSAGKHEIRASGSIADFTATGPLNFISDVKYDVSVK